MLIRRDEGGVLAIGQASHAWISGQLARAWGNDRFDAPEPREEVCLAAEQHDVGFGAWDLEPPRDPGTGLPLSFMDMPVPEHLKLWHAGPRRLITQSRYAALLVSMHGERLYRRRDLAKLPDAQAEDVRRYLDEQQVLQAGLAASLNAGRDRVADNSQLIWTWDFISLAVCLNWTPRAAADVPAKDGPVEMQIVKRDSHWTLDPWPFSDERLEVRCDARRLEGGPYPTDQALAGALENARWETLRFELRRA